MDDVKDVSGVGPMSDDGTSALLDLQLLWAYQLAADLENKLGMKDYAALYNGHAARLKMTIQNKYWNPARKLYADRAEKDFYSQHANTLAILTGMVEGMAAKQLAGQLTADTSLSPASIYFKYYLHEALIKAGFGNDYLNWLNIWRENIAMGLSTWGEDRTSMLPVRIAMPGDPARISSFSERCWASTATATFFTSEIEPHLGDLKKISGKIPHTNGALSVSYELVNGQWHIRIDLPPGITGTLVWKRKTHRAESGRKQMVLVV